MRIFGAGKKLFRRRGAKPLTSVRNTRISGNIFFALFAAVGMVGAVGYGFNTVIKGPIRGMTEVTKRTVAESTVVTTSKLAIVGATTQQTLGGDCDDDGFIEPIPYRDPGAGVRPVGGGYLPTDMLPSTLDPWNTEYGYCVWDAGGDSVSDAVVACGGATPRRLQGSPAGNQASIAIISAGRDKVFQTRCNAYVDTTPADGLPDNPLVVKTAGSDDIVLSYTYAEANDLGNGLWKPSTEPLKTANTTTSGKGLEVSGGGSFSDKVVLTGGGLVLPDQTSTGACDTIANDKQIRRNTTTSPPSIEICDFTGGLGWVSISGESATDDSGVGSGQLVGHWQLNESIGTIAKDRMARSDGTLINNPTWQPADGKLGGAASFNAADDEKIEIPRTDALEPSSVTVSAWIQVNGTPNDDIIVRKQWQSQSSPTFLSYALSINSSGRLIFSTGTTGSASGTMDPALVPSGEWLHVTGTYDPSGPAPQRKIYVNGAMVASNTITSPILYDKTATGNLYIGGGQFASQAFNGLIDDVRIYNYGMSAQEVEKLYQLGVPALNLQTVKKPGKLVSWGLDTDEALGNGPVEGNRTIPGPGIPGDFIDVSVSGSGGCGIKVGGTVWCWGLNTAGELGNGTTAPAAGAVQALNIDDAVQISRGGNTTCVLRKGGSIWCWGNNGDGQFGKGTAVSSAVPSKGPHFDDFVFVSAGNAITCGIRSSGEAWCWGRGTSGGLGNGANANSRVPVKVSNISNFSHLHAVNYQGVCGVTKEGKGYCWGTENLGNFGNGATSGIQNVPSEILNVSDFVKINILSAYACGLRASGEISCWGVGTHGALGTGNLSNTDVPAAVVNIDDFVDMAATSNSGCGIRKSGEAWCWGINTDGQLGNGTGNNSTIPVKVTGGNFHKIIGSPGTGFYVAITDPTVQNTAASTPNKISKTSQGGCFIRPDESLWCWGSDASGLLGNGGADTNSTIPVPVDNGGSALGWNYLASNLHTCGIKTDGTLWCWGEGTDGKLGNGTSVSSNVPSPVTVPDTIPWSSVRTSATNTCGIKSDGSGWCWGSDTNGALGNGAGGSSNIPVAIDGGGKWSTLDMGVQSACGIKSDGTLWCWGADTDGVLGNGPSVTAVQQSPYQVGTDKDWVDVNLSVYSACAIKRDGTAWCWGNSSSARLGINPAITNPDSPTLLLDPGPWQKIVFGSGSTCGLKREGSAWCWGTDTNGRLGNGPTVTAVQERPYPVDGGGTWKMLDGAGFGYCGVKTDDSVWCWGPDVNGSLGNGPVVTAEQHSPYPVSFIPAKAQFVDGDSGLGSLAQGHIAAGTTGIANAVPATRSLTFPGSGQSVLRETTGANRVLIDATESGSSAQMALSVPGYNYTFGFNAQTGTFGFAPGEGWIENLYPALEISNTGDVGIGTVGAPSAKLDVAGGIKLPADASCTGAKAGTLAYNAGKIQYCQGTWRDLERTDATVPLWDIGQESIGAGSGYTCAIKSDGTLWCWGQATSGQLGNGATLPDIYSPIMSGANLWTFVTTGSGLGHTCGIRSNGTLWCWGNATSGKLGLGPPSTNIATATQVGTDRWVFVSAGDAHTCGIKADGSLWCWGLETNGRLGTPPGPPVNSPSLMVHIGAKSVSAGGSHTCAIIYTGRLMCWGNGANGRLGNGGTASEQYPVLIGAAFWTSISAGGSHTCGIQSNGTLWCWGNDANGALGNSGGGSSNIPAQVETEVWTSISAGATHTCGLKSDRSLWCWGGAANGRLGNATTTPDIHKPMRIGTDLWLSIKTGANHTCGVKFDGTLWCWGGAANGRLGNGTTTPDVTTPLRVME